MSASAFGSPAPALHELGHARRIDQNQREHGREAQGDPLLGGCQVGDLGDQNSPVGVVGPLHSEILTPVEQQIGGGVLAQDLPQTVKFGRMFFVKKDRLQVETIEQDQAREWPSVRSMVWAFLPNRSASRSIISRTPGEAVRYRASSSFFGLGSAPARSHSPFPTVGADPGRTPGTFGLKASLISTPRDARSTTRAKVRFIDLSMPL